MQKSYDKVVVCMQNLESYKSKCESIIECKNFIVKTDTLLLSIFPLIKSLSGDYDDLDSYKTIIKTIHDDLYNLSEKLSELDNYNNWAKFRDTDKTLFKNLLKIPTNEWESNFKGVYYYNFLLNFEAESRVGFHKDDSKLKLLRDLYNELQEQNIKKIYNHWQEQRYKAIQDIESEYGFKALFALKKNQKFGKRLSLRQIIEKDFNSFTSLFPIIMVNPIVANALLPLKQGLFDLVIFDEASQLRIEDIYTSMIRGKYKIIAGDQHQMPPSNYFAAGLDGTEEIEPNEEQDKDKIRIDSMLDAQSLLEFSEYLKFKNRSYLDFHYRSKHPALINFSNAAFYGWNLCPLPVNGIDYTPIVLKEVNGIYESGKGKNINKEEAFEVVKLVAELKENLDGSMPSVGIATFNIHQRNCIREMLYQAAEDNSEFAEKFNKLKDSGLFIKNLENVQGDERDIIIISTTFGKDETGKFYERFATIGQDNGYKLMNVLITRAKKQLYLVTSIPESNYSTYKEIIDTKQENNRKAVLYAYISYAKAISTGQIGIADSILKDLRKFSYDKPRNNQAKIGNDLGGLTESVFEEEVYNEIVKIVGNEAITPQYKIGGYRLDFLIEINGHKIALECDGKTYHCTDQAYAEDMQRQKWIEKFGYEFHRIWSTNWFEDKNKEIIKFTRFIDSL
jgi:superfamily I DNA and/or RNA helicase/very-short-patch-repair endonuclease